MHELSLSQNIVAIVAQEASRHAFRRVRAVCLQIGALSGVDAEALRFGFAAVSQGSPAEGAELRIEAVPGAALCQDCQRSIEISEFFDPCPHCLGHRLKIIDGEQIRVTEIEVE